MAGRYPITALIALGLTVVNVMAWFVMLGGASALQHSRNTVVGLLNTVNQLPGTPLAYGNLRPINTTQNFISYQWFKAVLQVLTSLAILGVVGAGMLHHGRIALVGMLAVLCVFLSDSCDTFYYLYLETHKNPLVPKNVKREVESYFAGCIMCVTLDFLTLMALGAGRDDTATTNNYHSNPAATKDVGNGAQV